LTPAADVDNDEFMQALEKPARKDEDDKAPN
jgi:hypothetical protein